MHRVRGGGGEGGLTYQSIEYSHTEKTENMQNDTNFNMLLCREPMQVTKTNRRSRTDLVNSPIPSYQFPASIPIAKMYTVIKHAVKLQGFCVCLSIIVGALVLGTRGSREAVM